MKIPLFVLLVLHVGFAVCENSFTGFDSFGAMIDDLKKEMRNLFTTNHNHIEEKISTLMEENIRLSDAQNRLKHRLNQIQKSSEDAIQDLTNSCNNRITTISLESLKNDVKSTQTIIEGKIVSLAKEIDEKNAKITSSLDAIVELVRNNQNNTENISTNISRVTDSVENSMTNTDKNETNIEKKIVHLSPKDSKEHSKATNSLESLMNNTNIERKIEDLSTKMGEEHSKLSEGIVKFEQLESSMLESQKSLKDQYSDIASNVSLVANNTREILHDQLMLIKTCKEATTSGVYRLQNPSIQVYCEMDTSIAPSGCTVIYQRTDYKTNFNRSWAEYRDGFGTVGKDSDFWLGLEAIHQLTKSGYRELFVKSKYSSGVKSTQRFEFFQLNEYRDKYRLLTTNLKNFYYLHNNVQFSIYDIDNDSWNLAKQYGIGWWPYTSDHSQKKDVLSFRMMICGE